MSTRQIDSFIRCLRRFLGAGRMCALTDRQLLERFANSHDEEAFVILMERHGPMVLGVCRRMLGDEHEVEDAFQATFLVLARKAAGVKRYKSLGGFLHEVAWRIAVKARTASMRRREGRTLNKASEMSHTDFLSEVNRAELRAVLDEEITHLPAKYRDPVILCYLEGKTNEEAAQQLECSKGTIAGRLSRARELLRTRLVRRGLALPAAVFAAALSQAAASAAVPTTLMNLTFQIAAPILAGKVPAAGAISAHVLALAQDTIRSMFFSKVKTALAILLLSVSVPATAAAVYAYRSLDVEAEPTASSAPLSAPQQASAANAPEKSDRRLSNIPESVAPPLAASPLQARLLAKQDVYSLKPGLTAEDFKALVKKEILEALPRTPTVDLTLELRNISQEDLKLKIADNRIAVKNTLIELAGLGMEIELRGRGAVNVLAEDALPREIPLTFQEIVLAPGQSFSIPIKHLNTAIYDQQDRKVGQRHAYWTKPGEYRLQLRFHALVSPPPPDAVDMGNGFGMTTIACEPIKLQVR